MYVLRKEFHEGVQKCTKFHSRVGSQSSRMCVPKQDGVTKRKNDCVV